MMSFPTVFRILALSVVWTVAGAETPLLMDDKQTLYERVLSRPGAQLSSVPGASGGEPLPALSRFYVYERREHGGEFWLRVGVNDRRADGWMVADSTLPWKQQLALAFTNPANRDRALLFDDRNTVADLVRAEDPAAALAPIREAVETRREHPGVVAIEPEEHIDIREQFYLLPILDADPVVGTLGDVTVLQVASVSADATPASSEHQPASPDTRARRIAALKRFNATVVFVIDSTISMGPYIERTREAMRRVYARIEEAGLLDKVSFGLVAYRSNVEASPGLEYVSRVFVDPNKVRSGEEFLEQVEALSPATVSSARFNEDAYAGIMEALQSIDWNAFGGRYLVLISDAGALRAEDPLSGTELGAEEIRIEAEDRNVALHALHLQTDAGRRNHDSAERQYRSMTRNTAVGRSLYYGVEGGSVEAFGEIVDTLANEMVERVTLAASGELPDDSTTQDQESPAPSLVQQVQRDSTLLGHAMQLAYLGRVQGTRAPDLFQAWLSDRDIADPVIPTTEVNVLLTKNQLSDLRDVVRAILDAGEESQEELGSADFLDLLRSSAAHLSRDPNQLTDPNATMLGELGLLDEYLEDLPYKSKVLHLTSDIWESWSSPEQEDLLDELRRKLRLYQIFHDDGDRWVSLNPSADPGDDVYPVPLRALP